MQGKKDWLEEIKKSGFLSFFLINLDFSGFDKS